MQQALLKSNGGRSSLLRRAVPIVGAGILLWNCIALAFEKETPLGSSSADLLAQYAISDLLQNFWVENPSIGHFEYPCPIANGCMWEGAQAVNVLYSWWRIAHLRATSKKITSHWRWVKSNHVDADLSSCGHGTPENYASDDTAWDVGMFLQVYDVIHEKQALDLATDALDCAKSRWRDDTFDGGYWYDDSRLRKTNYQAIIILDEVQLFLASGNDSYLRLAEEDERWMSTHLLIRSDQSSVSPIGDGLYFNAYSRYGCNDKPGPDGCPYHMRVSNIAQSQTMLVANMAMCVIEAKLYKITGDMRYRTRMLKTASAIRAVETSAENAASGAVTGKAILTDDQDANVNAYVAYQYVTEVIRHLPKSERLASASMFDSTANAIFTNDRTPIGLYGGDWQGPIEGVWTRHGNNSVPENIVVSSNAVNIIVADAALRRQ